MHISPTKIIRITTLPSNYNLTHMNAHPVRPELTALHQAILQCVLTNAGKQNRRYTILTRASRFAARTELVNLLIWRGAEVELRSWALVC